MQATPSRTAAPVPITACTRTRLDTTPTASSSDMLFRNSLMPPCSPEAVYLQRSF